MRNRLDFNRMLHSKIEQNIHWCLADEIYGDSLNNEDGTVTAGLGRYIEIALNRSDSVIRQIGMVTKREVL